ncbi:MAG: serine/threonine-protein kinase [Verrucomicrobia bacterium]|nr:serine/threonine-protein kinase [Verrucomicrobiota bacterium]
MSARKHDIERIFSEAIELPESERVHFLDTECGDNTELRQRVDALLQAHDKSDGFLEDTGQDASFGLADSLRDSLPSDEMPGDRIGRYKLLERLGEGGWGVVWMAEQSEPIRRRVALKVLKLGMDTKEFVARFESERQALAMMDHPNIARVFDGGATELGRPYFVMELVRGIRISDYCDREQLNTRDRLQLFIKVCQAVNHAHQKGIIHRDLKPSNILVTVNDGEAVPKVIDFGIVKAAQLKLTDKTLFTHFHSFVGTPAYTSPEQMQMSSLDVDTRSDIYSLGVLLYELLSGKQPFDPTKLSELGIDAMRKLISEQDPPRPSVQVNSLNQEDRTLFAGHRGMEPEKFPKELKGDLDWIVMKCLEKNRSRRYETVNALAMDIERYLHHEAVLAGHPSKLYKIKKLIDRNRVAFGISVALVLSLLIGTATNAFLAIQAFRAEEHAQEEAQKTGEISEFIKGMFSYVDSLVELGQSQDANTRILKDTLKETFDRASMRIGDVSPDAEIEIYDILGAMYFKIREYASAEKMFRQELTKLRANSERDFPKLARTMNHLCAALARQGKIEEAELQIQEALNIQQQQLNEDGQNVARSMVNLSVIQVKKAGNVRLSDKAREEQLLKEQESIEAALEIQREGWGNEHEEIAASLNELGFILACQGGEKMAAAEVVIKEALNMNKKLLGNENPAVASSLNLLTIVQVIQEKYVEALDNYRAVQTIRQKLEETKARDVLSSYEVSVWEHQNTGAESLEALHDIVEFSLFGFEPDDLEVARLKAIQAFTYIEEGQYKEAEETALLSLAIREEKIPDHWSSFYAKSLLGGALFGQGRNEEADVLLTQGYEGVKARREQLEDFHKHRLNEALYRLIYFHSARGNAAKMDKLIQEATSLGLESPR